MRIFDESAHLVRTIIEITKDIKNFIFVFFLGILGFGVTFYIISNNNELSDDDDIKSARFINSFAGSIIYSYRLGLGDFALDTFDQN